MEAKKNSNNNFFKKNIYYFVLAFIMLAVVAVSLAIFVSQEAPSNTLNSSGGNNLVQRPNSSAQSKPNSSSGSNDKLEDETPSDTPTQTVISFILPVDNSTVICDYTSASVVYNQTLNVYTGHLAIDFGAEYGASVKAVYGGVIESVTASYLTGTTVTINHGNGLKTVYNSIEVDDAIQEGITVSQGAVIGQVSDNNRQEYKDGPHLHFEVWQDGEKISPYKYLTISEK